VAEEAGLLLLERFGGPASGVERKSTRTDMVSDADRDAEELVRTMLARERPDDGLLAEEGSQSEARSGRRWVVDPLDGTTNFLYGIPVWAVSVALEDEEGTLVGAVRDPVRDETFTAVRGGGARLDDVELTVDGSDRLETALVATGFSYDSDQRADQARLLTEILPRVRDIRRAGAAALDLCGLAAGRVDGYFERGLQHWDWAAASLVVTEAGGVVRRLDGEPAGLMAGAPGIADGLYTLVNR
jgi:myo-inositol-1(or 4)-monophosphatase